MLDAAVGAWTQQLAQIVNANQGCIIFLCLHYGSRFFTGWHMHNNVNIRRGHVKLLKGIGISSCYNWSDSLA